MNAVHRAAKRRFCLVLVKPSHYDDDGYVIQWFRSPIPSNSLASLYGLAKDCAERRVLGDDVDIEIHAFDETNTRIRPERIAATDRGRRRRHGDAGRRAVEPVSARARYRAAAARARHPGRDRRLPRLRRALDARRRRRRSRPRQGDGHLAVRRRGRRPARRGAARRCGRHAEAALQFHERSAGHRGHADPAAGRASARSARPAA